MSVRKIVIIVFFIALFKSTFFSHIGFGLLDEGESLHNAARILQGDLPYKDFFAIFPPIDNYFFALIFKIFGPNVLLPRIVMSILFSLGIGFLYLFLNKISNKFLAVITVLVIIFIDLNVERLFFFAPIFISLHLLSKEKIENKEFLLVGFLLGLVATFRADIPTSYFIAILIYLVLFSKKKLKKIGYSILGFSIPLFVVFIFLGINNLLPSFIYSTIYKSLEITRLHSLPFPAITDLIPYSFSASSISKSFTAFFGYTILLTYLLTFFLLFKKLKVFKSPDKFALLLLISGILSLPYIFGRSDMGHMVKGGLPAILLISWIGNNFYKKRAIGLIFVTGIFSLILIAQIIMSIFWLKFNDTKVNIGNNKIIINNNYILGSTAVSAKTLYLATNFLIENSNTNEPVLVLPYMAGLYYLADRPSATNYNNVLNGFLSNSEEENNFIKEVKDSNVRAVVYDPNNGPKMKVSKLKEYNPLVHEFIMRHFMVKQETPEGWLFMTRKEVDE